MPTTRNPDASLSVEFIPRGVIGSADIYLDGVIFEIKSPLSSKANTIEHRLKDAVNSQSSNIILDSSRIKNKPDYSLKNYLINRMRKQRQIRQLIFITKQGKIIDIGKLI
ncbi:hypothetical protein IJG73_01900 [Candidatus Saccharibacteria bacterium]|nr:hypothetical protein [Candidatus Saccharibacteria bacterium]